MQEIVGIILVVFGLILILVGVLAWLGVLKPRVVDKAQGNASFIDLLMALLDKAPWVVVVGLILVVLGLAVLGVDLS
ncbi:MAG: hypothetical protein U9R58_15015 [Chloroflexota bacterium]|nr:hypothetical protein [Chloroflexota bacterium]